MCFDAIFHKDMCIYNNMYMYIYVQLNEPRWVYICIYMYS